MKTYRFSRRSDFGGFLRSGVLSLSVPNAGNRRAFAVLLSSGSYFRFGSARDRGMQSCQEIASIPFRWMTFRSFNEGPLGRFSPISHFWTVETLVLSIAANTA